jgi:hypothetical protein
MVKSYERESEVLQALGYGSSTQATVVASRPTVRTSRTAGGTTLPRNSSERTRRVYSDEQRHTHGRAKLRHPRRIHPDLLMVAKMTVVFAVSCALLLICVTAHMQETYNAQKIQNLTKAISLANSEHDSLTNKLALISNQLHVATEAHHFKMIQSPASVTVALTYGQGEPALGPQVADAQ